MEEQEKLTMELVKSLMDKSYTLVWVDYNDNLDNCRDKAFITDAVFTI